MKKAVRPEISSTSSPSRLRLLAAALCFIAAVGGLRLAREYVYLPFSLDDYRHQVEHYDRFYHSPKMTSPISASYEAITAHREIFEGLPEDEGPFFYTVYRDLRNDCWFVKATPYGTIHARIIFCGGVAGGGDRCAIISSDGRILATWIEM